MINRLFDSCPSRAYCVFVLWFARPERWFGTGKRVRIPRCRATVSEEPAAGHWASPGKAGGPIADCTGQAGSVLTR